MVTLTSLRVVLAGGGGGGVGMCWSVAVVVRGWCGGGGVGTAPTGIFDRDHYSPIVVTRVDFSRFFLGEMNFWGTTGGYSVTIVN